MSSGETTKEAATRSTPISRPKARSMRSLSVTTGRPRRAPGKAAPLWSESMPPWTTTAPTPPATRPRHPHLDEPVGEEHPVAAPQPGGGQVLHEDPAGTAFLLAVEQGHPGPGAQFHPAPGEGPHPDARALDVLQHGHRPALLLGGGRAPSPATGRGSRGVPWEKLSRATSMPAATRRPIISREATAGPRVAMILVLRSTVRATIPGGAGRRGARRPPARSPAAPALASRPEAMPHEPTQQPGAGVLAALPLKAFAAAKGRLDGLLEPPARAALSRAVAERVAAACVGAGAAVAVVTADPAWPPGPGASASR